MFILLPVREHPGRRSFERGVALLRGMVLPTIDLRVCLGLLSAPKETEALVQLMTDREEDHRRWLAELTASVIEARPFGLAVDPHACAFGRWYDAFRTDDAVLRGALQAFEAPHAAVHALAGEASALVGAGRAGEALARLERARGAELAAMLEVFQRARDALRSQHREVGVAVHLQGKPVALVVDRAEAVAELAPLSDDDDPLRAGVLQTELMTGLGRWKGRDMPVMMLDLERLAKLR
jgi:purine-binding chemotaxis protein CheW